MRISKRHLRRIIKEALTSYESEIGAPSEFVEANWVPWLEERGLTADDLDDLAHHAGAPDRSWLEARPPSDGMIGPADLELWAKDQTAAREILSTRAGDYSSSPYGKKVNEGARRGSKVKITKRQLKRIIREQMAATSYQGNLDPEIALVNTVRDLVGNNVMFFDFKNELLAAGFDGTEVTTEPISMVTVPDINGKMFVITSKRNVEGPDHVVGSYAIGPLE